MATARASCLSPMPLRFGRIASCQASALDLRSEAREATAVATKHSRPSSPWPLWVLFAMAVALAGAFLAFAPRLSRVGFSKPMFFVVLVPLGLASAAFLKQALNATSAAV